MVQGNRNFILGAADIFTCFDHEVLSCYIKPKQFFAHHHHVLIAAVYAQLSTEVWYTPP
jgi:hypothetical protein